MKPLKRALSTPAIQKTNRAIAISLIATANRSDPPLVMEPG